MYFLPFKTLIEKIPFLKFLVRYFKFIHNPSIETESEFTNGDMQYALYDIVSVISLSMIATNLINLVNHENHNNILSLFLNLFTLYFQFGYYAFWSILMFFILILVALFIRFWKIRLKEAFFCTLQYARVYALFLFVFLLALPSILNDMIYGFYTDATTSVLVFLFCLCIYLRCYLIPISTYSSIHTRRRITIPLFLIISLCSCYLNTYAPNIGKLEFDYKKAYSIMFLNGKFKDVRTTKNKMRFFVKCKHNNNLKFDS